MHRHEITDRQWVLVAPLLSAKVTDCGVTARDNRLFFNAVVWLLRTGAAWADLPERFGKPLPFAAASAGWPRKKYGKPFLRR